MKILLFALEATHLPKLAYARKLLTMLIILVVTDIVVYFAEWH